MSTVDELMAKDPNDITAEDVDSIIEWHRQQRRNFEAGIKPKKESGPKAELSSVVAALIPAGPALRRL